MNSTSATAIRFIENNQNLDVKEWGRGMRHVSKPLSWAMNEVVSSKVDRPDVGNYTLSYKNAVIITKDGYGKRVPHGVTVGHAISKAGISIDDVKKVVIVENFETSSSGKIATIRKVTEYYGKVGLIRRLVTIIKSWIK